MPGRFGSQTPTIIHPNNTISSTFSNASRRRRFGHESQAKNIGIQSKITFKKANFNTNGNCFYPTNNSTRHSFTDTLEITPENEIFLKKLQENFREVLVKTMIDRNSSALQKWGDFMVFLRIKNWSQNSQQNSSHGSNKRVSKCEIFFWFSFVLATMLSFTHTSI